MRPVNAKELDAEEEIEISAPRRFGEKVALGVFGICLIWVLSYVVIWTYFGKLELASQFGGMFGAVSALFSGLALAGIVVAIYLQSQELSLQRQELKLTRRELAKSAAAQQRSEHALSEQAKALASTAKLTALQFQPLLEVTLTLGNLETNLLINNLGSTPAFDVEVRTLCVYASQSIDIESFLKTHVVKSDVRLRDWEPDSGGEFAVSDRMNAFTLPGGRKLSGRVIVPLPVNRILVLLQFRDIQGVNFGQKYIFFRRQLDERTTYSLFNRIPVTPVLASRVEDGEQEHPEIYSADARSGNGWINTLLTTENGSGLPVFLEEGFSSLWNNSIPSTYIGVPWLYDDERLSLIANAPLWRPIER